MQHYQVCLCIYLQYTEHIVHHFEMHIRLYIYRHFAQSCLHLIMHWSDMECIVMFLHLGCNDSQGTAHMRWQIQYFVCIFLLDTEYTTLYLLQKNRHYIYIVCCLPTTMNLFCNMGHTPNYQDTVWIALQGIFCTLL